MFLKRGNAFYLLMYAKKCLEVR